MRKLFISTALVLISAMLCFPLAACDKPDDTDTDTNAVVSVDTATEGSLKTFGAKVIEISGNTVTVAPDSDEDEALSSDKSITSIFDTAINNATLKIKQEVFK